MGNNFDASFFVGEKRFISRSQRRAGRLEFGSDKDTRSALAIARPLFKYVEVFENSSGGADLFYSDDLTILKCLIFHTRRVERGDTESIRVTGKILGYPDCCVDSYIKERMYLAVDTGLNWLIKRIEHKGLFDHRINPFNSGIRHIPCSLGCRETLKQAILLRQVFAVHENDHKNDAYITPLPFSATISNNRCITDYIKIRLLDYKGNRVHYRYISCTRDFEDKQVFSLGNLLCFDSGNLVVSQKGQREKTFILKYFLWSPRFLPEREFFRNLFFASFHSKLANITQYGARFYYYNKRYISLLNRINGLPKELVVGKNILTLGEPLLLNNMIVVPIYFNSRKFSMGFQLNEDAPKYYFRGRFISVSIIGDDFIEDPLLKMAIKYIVSRLEGASAI